MGIRGSDGVRLRFVVRGDGQWLGCRDEFGNNELGPEGDRGLLNTGGMSCGRQISERVLTAWSTKLRANLCLLESREDVSLDRGALVAERCEVVRSDSLSQAGVGWDGDDVTEVAGVLKIEAGEVLVLENDEEDEDEDEEEDGMEL